MTSIPEVKWLLACQPRPVQVEALLRSYHGVATRGARTAAVQARGLPHRGGPARGWGHFLEMRLGKTPTMLNEYLLFQRDHGFRRMLMLAPNKYKGTWALEAQKFGIIDPIHVFESKDRDDFKRFMNKHNEGLVFVNYEALIYDNNCDLFEQWIDDRTYMGADESVLIKGHNSTTTRNAINLSKGAGVTRASSGKPSPQGIHDMFSQLKFARALDGWNFFQFRNKFAKMGGFKGKKVVGVINEDKWHKIRDDHSFFARRADWGTSIKSDYEQVKLDMTPKMKTAYRTMEEEFITWLDEGGLVTAEQVITKHMKLQQISSGFIIDEFKETHWLEEFKKTPKFIDLQDRLTNYISGKTLIFFHYTATGNALIEALKPLNPAIIRGGPYMKKFGLDVDQEKNRFNNDPDCTVLVGQTKATKYGHTLMGTEQDPCLTSIYFENTYSLDDRAQTEERNQGEGQLDAINIVDYYSSPVEKSIIGALQTKEEIASRIMGYYRG